MATSTQGPSGTESAAEHAARLAREYAYRYGELREAARALLERIDNMTTADFARGGEVVERERLRHVLFDATEGSAS